MRIKYCPCGHELVSVMGEWLYLCKSKEYPHLWSGDMGVSDNRSLKMAQEILRLKARVGELETSQVVQP